MADDAARAQQYEYRIVSLNTKYNPKNSNTNLFIYFYLRIQILYLM